MSRRRSSDTLDMMLMSLLANNRGLSGYELASLLRAPIPFIWPVKHSQIYPALGALESRGNLVAHWVAQQGRPNKKVYELSPQGLQHLTDWLREPRDALSDEEAMLIAYNLPLVGPAILATRLGAYRRQCAQEKAQLEARWGEVSPEAHRDAQRILGIRAVYEYALGARDARIAWCDWLLERAHESAAPIAKPASGARSGD